MSLGGFLHTVETGVVSAEQHVVKWVKGEAPKVEELAIKIETWVGANATAKAFFQPMVDTIESEVTTLGKDAIAALGGTTPSLEGLLQAVEKDIPALLTRLETQFIASAKAADPTSHTSVVIGLLNFAYALVSPKLGTILGALLPAAV